MSDERHLTRNAPKAAAATISPKRSPLRNFSPPHLLTVTAA
jgi:hypothetical protein